MRSCVVCAHGISGARGGRPQGQDRRIGLDARPDRLRGGSARRCRRGGAARRSAVETTATAQIARSRVPPLRAPPCIGGKVRGDRGGDARLEPAERDGGPACSSRRRRRRRSGIHDHGRVVDARPRGQTHGEGCRVASDVEDRAASTSRRWPNQTPVMSVGGEPDVESTDRSRRSRRGRASCSCSANGPKRYRTPSTTGSPTRAAWASTASVSATEMPSGFSHSTALPASAAWASSAWVVWTVPMYTASTSSREHLVVRAGDRSAVPVGELTRPDAVACPRRAGLRVRRVRQRREEVTRDDAGAQDRPACFAHGSTLAAPVEAHAQGMPRSVTADPSQSPAPP